MLEEHRWTTADRFTDVDAQIGLEPASTAPRCTPSHGASINTSFDGRCRNTNGCEANRSSAWLEAAP